MRQCVGASCAPSTTAVEAVGSCPVLCHNYVLGQAAYLLHRSRDVTAGLPPSPPLPPSRSKVTILRRSRRVLVPTCQSSPRRRAHSSRAAQTSWESTSTQQSECLNLSMSVVFVEPVVVRFAGPELECA